jgi:3-dehydroquinate dehydratase
MKILVCQSVHEEDTVQLEHEIMKTSVAEIVVFPEGYLANHIALKKACNIARQYKKVIITGYRDQQRKNRAVISPN